MQKSYKDYTIVSKLLSLDQTHKLEPSSWVITRKMYVFDVSPTFILSWLLYKQLLQHKNMESKEAC